MKEDLKLIIQQSINAPSGDNCQPWKFKIIDDSVYILVRSDGNNDFLDFKLRGTYVAHGALIENMVLTATLFGYETTVELFPAQMEKATARLIFKKSLEIKVAELANAIPLRHTNRKVCTGEGLSTSHISALQACKNKLNTDISFVTDEKQKSAIAFAASRMEKLALENPLIHSLFFKSIVWTKDEESKKEYGLYIKTLELPPPVQALFKLLRSWKVTSFLNKIGFSSKAAQGNAEVYASSQLFALFSVKDTRPESFIETGRAMEQVWLTANKQGLSVQPLAGLIYISQRLEEDTEKHFTDKEAALIRSGISTIKSNAQIHDTIISMILRIGIAKKPTAISTKREPIIE